MSAPANFRHDPDPDQALRDDWTTDELRALTDAELDRVFDHTAQAGGWGHGPALLDRLERHDLAAATGTERHPR